MDPNETLRQIREITESNDPGFRSDMQSTLESLVDALDDWLSRGGFLPVAWQRLDNGLTKVTR